MKTEIIKLNSDNIDMDRLRYAAEVIKGGGLVAFPTETVYGLGANALNEAAVKKVFEAKGRPSDNPLIAHIADKMSVDELVSCLPENASRLIDKFWPGPLTIIMHKSCIVPSIITAGLDTVAVRMPSHPVAHALIRESGLPIAAPSANTSGKPSPTAPKHVIDDLSGKVDVIIDSGFTKLGLESTVLDMTSNPPAILRPGGITLEQLEKILPRITIDPGLIAKEINSLASIPNISPKSPGMKYTHYSPKADVIVVEGELTRIVDRINQMIDEYKAQGVKIGVLATEQTLMLYKDVEIICAGDRNEPETIAANLFGALREFDERNVEVILAEAVDNSGIGLAVMNRMNKAAGYNIIKV